MRTIKVVLTIHAAVRCRARANLRDPVLLLHLALPKTALLAGNELAVPGGRFRLSPRALAGEYLAATFLDGPGRAEARTERVAVMWQPPRA